MYESIKPLHHFHMEYQLTPGTVSPTVYKTDIVTYSIIAKVFTEHDERVVNMWKEGVLTYYGWKHRYESVTRSCIALPIALQSPAQIISRVVARLVRSHSDSAAMEH